MIETERMLNTIPKYLILEDRVYEISVSYDQSSSRAFHRGLIDFRVEGTNPLTTSDRWRTLLGVSDELYSDYQSYGTELPLAWLLLRFLCHHVRTNSIHILKGHGGQVLMTTNFRTYLGSVDTDEKADETLRIVLSSWVRAFPGKILEFGDIYISTDLKQETLKRSINSFIVQDSIEEISEHKYKIKPSILNPLLNKIVPISLDRKSNRYYQEVYVQAKEPFCFVMMPFKEKEFKQSIYLDIIKPFIEDEFEVSCYRVDEDDLPDRIDNKIYTYILRSAFIVAEVTTRNPNVLYELGLAHMLEKDCIIITQEDFSKMPFDINRISAKTYKNDDELKSCLRKSISALAFKIRKIS